MQGLGGFLSLGFKVVGLRLQGLGGLLSLEFKDLGGSSVVPG